MQRVSTDALDGAGRAEAWNRLYSHVLAAADIIPTDADFTAGLTLGRVGQLGLARLATGRCTIRRTAEHIDASSPQLYSVIVQAHGRGSLVQGRNSAVLNPGDFALCDHAVPHSRTLDTGAELLLIRVPAEIIAEYLPFPDQLCGRRLPAGAGLTPSAGAMVRSLWRRLEEGVDTPYEDCLAHQVLELIATSYAMVFGAELGGDGRPDARLTAVQAYVEDRLYDPDFKPGGVARDLRISPREICRLFAARGETLRSYVQRRRLQEAARRLRDPRWRGHTVAEIAYCCGFVSAALFARSFRQRYGLSATEYRGRC